MRPLYTLALPPSLAALLAFATPVAASEHDLTAEDVEAYFQQVQQQATEMAQAEEWHRIPEWIETNIADGAVFQMNLNVVRGEEPKGFASFTIDRDDMVRMGGLFVGLFQQHEVEQYSLQVEVTNVISHGPGAATASVRWSETLSMTGDYSIEQEADCTHLVQRQGEQLIMGLSTCTGEARL